MIHHRSRRRCYPSCRLMFIARQRKRWRAMPLSGRLSVARLAPNCAILVHSPCRLPGSTCFLRWPLVQLPRLPGTVSRCGIISWPAPLPSREPGWTSASRWRHCWRFARLGAVPRVPVGVRCPVRRSLCTLRFRRSRGIFEVTGLSPESPVHPQKFLVHPPFTHRLCTGHTLTATQKPG